MDEEKKSRSVWEISRFGHPYWELNALGESSGFFTGSHKKDPDKEWFANIYIKGDEDIVRLTYYEPATHMHVALLKGRASMPVMLCRLSFVNMLEISRSGFFKNGVEVMDSGLDAFPSFLPTIASGRENRGLNNFESLKHLYGFMHRLPLKRKIVKEPR